METEKKLEMVHFQITKNCNLRCSFCGQWGKNGFFSDANGIEMTLNDWKSVIKQLIEYRKNTGVSPFIMLWGGEPLMSADFDEIVTDLHENGLKIGMVTNGTMLDGHSEIVNKCVDKVYVSIDGEEKLHNSIRGAGVYAKVTKNLSLIKTDKVTIMTVLTDKLDVVKFSETFKEYKILLQELIPFENQQIPVYSGKIPENVTYLRHGENAKREFCLSPWRHIHITWNGEVTFCTDFYNYSIGNVKKESIKDVFNSEKAEQFRKSVLNGENENCKYCSWKNNSKFV